MSETTVKEFRAGLRKLRVEETQLLKSQLLQYLDKNFAQRCVTSRQGVEYKVGAKVAQQIERIAPVRGDTVVQGKTVGGWMEEGVRRSEAGASSTSAASFFDASALLSDRMLNQAEKVAKEQGVSQMAGLAQLAGAWAVGSAAGILLNPTKVTEFKNLIQGKVAPTEAGLLACRTQIQQMGQIWDELGKKVTGNEIKGYLENIKNGENPVVAMRHIQFILDKYVHVVNELPNILRQIKPYEKEVDNYRNDLLDPSKTLVALRGIIRTAPLQDIREKIEKVWNHISHLTTDALRDVNAEQNEQKFIQIQKIWEGLIETHSSNSDQELTLEQARKEVRDQARYVKDLEETLKIAVESISIMLVYVEPRVPSATPP